MIENRRTKDRNKSLLIASVLGLLASFSHYQKNGLISESIGYFVGTTLTLFPIIFLFFFAWRWKKSDIENSQDRKFLIKMGIVLCLLLLMLAWSLIRNIILGSIGDAAYNFVMLCCAIVIGKKLYRLLF